MFFGDLCVIRFRSVEIAEFFHDVAEPIGPGCGVGAAGMLRQVEKNAFQYVNRDALAPAAALLFGFENLIKPCGEPGRRAPAILLPPAAAAIIPADSHSATRAPVNAT